MAVHGVNRHYGSGDGRVNALNDVSLVCSPHTWTAIMGPSGSGKSTLLHCAAGLERVHAGQVFLGGREITAMPERELTLLRRRDIGFVFQSFNLLAGLTAEQNVGLPLQLSGERHVRDRAREALGQVGLADKVAALPRQLSGGQQQRVAIARALAAGPALVFADEPTGALDSVGAQNILRTLRRLVDDHGRSIVMVTHDPLAASFADRIVFLRDGRLSHELGRSTSAEIAGHLARMEG